MERYIVNVVGTIWMPAITAATSYNVSWFGGHPAPETREEWEEWCATHAGDFQSVKDFEVIRESGNYWKVEREIIIPFANEESELTYWDCVSPVED